MPLGGPTKYPFTILYKSGQKVHIRAEEVVVHFTTEFPSRVARIDWTGIEPDSIYTGLSNIEAVWNGHV